MSSNKLLKMYFDKNILLIIIIQTFENLSTPNDFYKY